MDVAHAGQPEQRVPHLPRVHVRRGPLHQHVDRVDDQLAQPGLREFNLRSEFLLLMGNIAGAKSTRGRLALREIINEPTSSMDNTTEARFKQRLSNVMTNKTLIMVTHRGSLLTLVDRLIVMEKGYAAQIGSPLEVYEQPANLFVAGFIGSPAMNFFDGRLSDDGRRVVLPADIEFSLPDGGLPQAGGKDVVLGIRPEHFEPAPDNDAKLRLRVDHVELLGADTLVYGRFGDDHPVVTVRIPDVKHYGRNTQLPLTVSPDKLHVFDKNDHQRVVPGSAKS